MAGALEGLFFFPRLDFGVVAGEENIGDCEAAKFVGLGVGGSFQQVGVGEGFVFGGALVTEGPGRRRMMASQRTGGGEGSVGEDVVAEGEFEVDELGDPRDGRRLRSDRR